jgi:mono/diheme cytochrome c family protein
MYALALAFAAVPAWRLMAQAPGNAAGDKSGAVKATGIMLISRPRPDAAAVERGKGLFTSSCGFCHGANATGGAGGPDLIRSEMALDDEGGNRIGPVIRQGRGMMPAFATFTNEQIQDVAAFLRERQIAAIDRREYEIQNVATGDPRRGEAYFSGAGGCTECHSTTGDMKGIAVKYEEEPYMLQVRMLNPRTQRPTVATVTDAAGKVILGRLIEIDDFVVTMRDSSGTRLTIPRGPGVKVDIRHPLARHREMLKTWTDESIHDVLAYLVTLP